MKNDIVLSYIESLKAGEKISVRLLAAKLNVSEGTAYKALKVAESQNLVITKPKSGTIRINSTTMEHKNLATFKDMSKLLGLTTITGKNHLDYIIKKIIICDSDEAQLVELLENCDPENTLCLCGNRPEIQSTVLKYDANLLITGNGFPTDYQCIQAEKKNICIFTSVKNTYALIRQIDNLFPTSSLLDDESTIVDWMQTPDYLYYNDIVEDWHKFYHDNLSNYIQYPLIDEEQHIYGALNISKAFEAMPSQRLSTLTTDDESVLVADESESPQVVAKKMIMSGNHVAAVVSHGKMEGVVSANDLLRYYMYSNVTKKGAYVEPFLSLLEEGSPKEPRVYNLRIPKNEFKNIAYLEVTLILESAVEHAKSAGFSNTVISSSTFYALTPLVASDTLMLTSTMIQSSLHKCVIESEIHDDTHSFAKAVLIFTEA